MANEDLSKLKIDKTTEILRPQKRRKLIYAAALILLVLLLGILYNKRSFQPCR